MKNHCNMFFENGKPIAQVDDYIKNGHLIGAFLTIDVSDDKEYCEELIRETELILSGRLEKSENALNLFIIIISKKEVIIENAYNSEDSVNISLNEFLDIIKSWESLLSSRE